MRDDSLITTMPPREYPSSAMGVPGQLEEYDWTSASMPDVAPAAGVALPSYGGKKVSDPG